MTTPTPAPERTKFQQVDACYPLFEAWQAGAAELPPEFFLFRRFFRDLDGIGRSVGTVLDIFGDRHFATTTYLTGEVGKTAHIGDLSPAAAKILHTVGDVAGKRTLHVARKFSSAPEDVHLENAPDDAVPRNTGRVIGYMAPHDPHIVQGAMLHRRDQALLPPGERHDPEQIAAWYRLMEYAPELTGALNFEIDDILANPGRDLRGLAALDVVYP